MATIIDPPEGWRFGFPKVIPEERLKDVNVWLVEQGYPIEIIEKMKNFFCYRTWEEDDENNPYREK